MMNSDSSKKFAEIAETLSNINAKPRKKPNVTRRLMQVSADIKNSRQRKDKGGMYGEVTSDLSKNADKALTEYRKHTNVSKAETNRLRNITLREIRQLKIEEKRKKRIENGI